MVGQGPAVFAADAGRVGCLIFVLFFVVVFFLLLLLLLLLLFVCVFVVGGGRLFSSRLSYLPFLMLHFLGDGWTY